MFLLCRLVASQFKLSHCYLLFLVLAEGGGAMFDIAMEFCHVFKVDDQPQFSIAIFKLGQWRIISTSSSLMDRHILFYHIIITKKSDDSGLADDISSFIIYDQYRNI